MKFTRPAKRKKERKRAKFVSRGHLGLRLRCIRAWAEKFVILPTPGLPPIHALTSNYIN